MITRIEAYRYRCFERINVPIGPFAVLVDLKLPDGGFGDALHRVHERWPGIPTIVMTAFGRDEPDTRGAECFHKPFDTTALLGRIEALYREHHRA